MTINHGCGTCTHKRKAANGGWVCPFVKVQDFVRDEIGQIVGVKVEREEPVSLTIAGFAGDTSLDVMKRNKRACYGERYEFDGSTKTCAGCGLGHSNDGDHCDKCEKTSAEMLQARVSSMKRRGIIR